MVDFVFEISSEAGRKVGGIYTVLKTKSGEMVRKFADRYFLVGYYDTHSARDEFTEHPVPEEFAPLIQELHDRGIDVRYGRWSEGNNAQIFLVDGWKHSSDTVQVPFGSGKDSRLNLLKYQLWKTYGIDSLFISSDFNESVVWANAVGMLIEGLVKLPHFKGEKIVCHAHEWIAGPALLHLKSQKVPVATVFTTHATVLGRSLTSSGVNLMKLVGEGLKKGEVISPQEAYRYKLEGKHQMEVTCAREADIFTTVSNTVALEVQYVLGRKPDVVTLNGIDLESVISPGNDATRTSRGEIDNFVEAMFLPHYEIKPGNCIYTYLAGRYEFENKGIDLFIDALGQTNRRAKELPDGKTLVAFLFVPSNATEPVEQLTENMLIIDRVKEILIEAGEKNYDVVEILEKQRGNKKFASIAKLYNGLRKTQDGPQLCAMKLNYFGDSILNRIKQNNLLNRKEDKVKVIFYPTYLKPGDGVLNMEYYDVMAGCDMGVFPSRYEPWGYTPVEAAALLTLAVTSEAAGFGKFILNQYGSTQGRGIKVVLTEGKKDEEIVSQLSDILVSVATMPPTELAALKQDAQDMIQVCDWKTQIRNYLLAYELAIKSLGES